MTIHIYTFCTAIKHEPNYEFPFKRKSNPKNKIDKEDFVDGESVTAEDMAKIDMEIIQELEELYID